jgi:hypothetical protein
MLSWLPGMRVDPHCYLINMLPSNQPQVKVKVKVKFSLEQAMKGE